MEAIAKARYLRTSTLKVRKIIKVVRGKSVSDALAILNIMPNKAAKMIYKVVFSAVANFKNIFPEEDEKQLEISAIYADEGSVFKRLLPRARGRADILRKQTSHLTVKVMLAEVKDEKVKTKQKEERS